MFVHHQVKTTIGSDNENLEKQVLEIWDQLYVQWVAKVGLLEDLHQHLKRKRRNGGIPLYRTRDAHLLLRIISRRSKRMILNKSELGNGVNIRL